MNKSNENKFQLLRTKKIIAIFDGDSSFGETLVPNTQYKINIAMPYLSAPDICEISSTFGLIQTYEWGGFVQSRWVYFDNLLEYVINENKISKLLNYLFSKVRFKKVLNVIPASKIDETYSFVVNQLIDQINSELYFGGNRLEKIDNTYYIHNNDNEATVETPSIDIIDRDYICELSKRALIDISQGHFDSAITKSRTLLEEVFCYVIEKKGEIPSTKGDVGILYNQVKSLYNMHADKDMDKRIKCLLSGLEKIISSISEMRNKDSDSHGVGSKRRTILEYHARLFVNSSMAMSDFILSVANNN